jgi:hypothetical protein
MIAVNNQSGTWPTRDQELILRAALLQGDEAIKAWNEWKRKVDIEVLDFGSHRMIPRLYRNLLDHDVKDPLLDRFKSVYRYYLYKNEILLHHTAAVVSSFRDAGIATMLLKGSALIPLYYKESALRPMQDVDIMVPAEQAVRAMKLLQEQGRRVVFTTKPVFTEVPEDWISIRHSLPFEDGSGRQIDLHWHLLWECHSAGDSEYWDSAVPIVLGNVQTLVLSPTYQLLHTCWHGGRWSEVPPIRWIPDAMAILKGSQNEIDWDLFVQQARRHHLSLLLHDCLEWLRNLVEAPIPSSVVKALHDLPVSGIERIGYQAAISPPAPPSTGKILALLVYDYLWLTSSTNRRPRSFAFAKLVQSKWVLEHLWQVPFYLCFRALLRAFRITSGYISRWARSTVGAHR